MAAILFLSDICLINIDMVIVILADTMSLVTSNGIKFFDDELML